MQESIKDVNQKGNKECRISLMLVVSLPKLSTFYFWTSTAVLELCDIRVRPCFEAQPLATNLHLLKSPVGRTTLRSLLSTFSQVLLPLPVPGLLRSGALLWGTAVFHFSDDLPCPRLHFGRDESVRVWWPGFIRCSTLGLASAAKGLREPQAEPLHWSQRNPAGA